MKFFKKFFLLSAISKALAAEFAVVSFDGDCQVNIGNKLYPMTRDSRTRYLYKANIEVPEGTKYYYSCGGNNDYERTLSGKKTYNELFGRALTLYDMPEFGYPNAEPWTRSIGRTELFDPTYVPIVILDATSDDIVTLATKGSLKLKGFTIILKENVFSFTGIPTSSKNTEESKFQFQVTLPGDGIYHRTSLKFRPSWTDPVFFRQLLYSDIAHAIGNPAHEGVAVRVYLSNGKGVGLYALQEDVTKESFISTAFYGTPEGDVKSYEPSVIYDCHTGADFTAQDGRQLGAFINDREDQKIELLAMTQKLEALDVLNEAAVSDFDQNDLDLDTLLRALALEYLAGHWDSYWGLTTNFVLYHPTDDPGNYKFYFVDQDFDQTWGVGLPPYLEPLTYPTSSYTTKLFRDDWQKVSQNEFDTPTRIVLSKLIGCDHAETCITKQMFEAHLQSIVKHIFNPVAIRRKVEGYKARLTEEMEWDLSFPRIFQVSHSNFPFTMDDFNSNIETGDYPGSILYYGIMDWTEKIANTVCAEFDIEYDKVPYTPETASQASVQPIDAESPYDQSANLMSASQSKRKIPIFTVGLLTLSLGLILAKI